jgi:CDP-4-dehydro-6-deoxyglucose reductase
MPDPKFVKPWHGIPREQIKWHPSVDEDGCIGCGTCVTGCNRLVYRYDYDRKKAVMEDPLNCLVGCVTCGNTCPTHAISFPPLDTITSLLSKPEVHHEIEDSLLARKDQFQWIESLPHQDRIVEMIVDKIVKSGEQTLIVRLAPKNKSADCFCQFMPGQYIEIWIPNSQWMSRAYSIGNAPLEDGSIEIQIRKVEGGRFSTWAFERTQIGDLLSVRGPLGNFTNKSKLETPLLFVAGSTGFAPIRSMIEQQLRMSPNKRIVLFWGARTFSGFYELDIIESWFRTNPNLTCILATRNSSENDVIPHGCTLVKKSLVDVIEDSQIDLTGYDVYIAGPPSMIPAVSKKLADKGIPLERIRIDSFGN